MVKRNRLTNNSDETDIASFLSGDSVFAIPFFQRSYCWKPQRLTQLNQDILTIVDQSSELVHFLGAVIIYGRSSNPSDPKVYEVIDGQQRITTLFLYLAAAIKTLAEYEQFQEAGGLFQKYLAIPRDTNLRSNIKLHPCKEDRAQFNHVVEDLLKEHGLYEKVSTAKIKYLPESGQGKGILWNNYKSALRFFKSQYDQGGIERVRDVYKAMLESMSLVQIDVWDPTNGPKIFDSLNSRQEPMTIGDLVRNEVFSKVADEEPETVEQIDQQDWQPFYKKFQEKGHNLFVSYFFPYGLILNPNLKKSEVYSALRQEWHDMKDPQAIIKKLALYQDTFLDIVTGSNTKNHTQKVADLIKNIHKYDAPSSTYPFLMQLSNEFKIGTVSEKDAIDILSMIESFLVRRAVCGQEPTGLHAVFKRLWTDCQATPNKEKVKAEIQKHKTVLWPNDLLFKQSIQTRPLYGVGITPYIIRQYDHFLGGDQPGVKPWIEHVLPESPAKEWFTDFTKEQHRDMKDLLANLIPLTKQMNQEVSNQTYMEKKKIYEADSMFKSARQFALSYKQWNPSTLKARALILADWAVKRWPY
jgi:uncharacterized protein with ParB-like and HNH nuclease domain